MRHRISFGRLKDERQQPPGSVGADHDDSRRLASEAFVVVHHIPRILIEVLGGSAPDIIRIIDREAVLPQFVNRDFVAVYTSVWDVHCHTISPATTKPGRSAGLRVCVQGAARLAGGDGFLGELGGLRGAAQGGG